MKSNKLKPLESWGMVQLLKIEEIVDQEQRI